MFPWNPDLNIQLSAQHFRLMSNRISNLIFPKPNCWSSNVLPVKSTPLHFLHLRKWPLHPSSCSVKQNSWCLFSLTHSPPVNTVSLTLRIDTGSNHCSHLLYTSTLWWKGQARQPLSDLTCEPPRYVPPSAFPLLRVGTECNLQSHKMKIVKSSWPESLRIRGPVDLKHLP